MRSVIQHIQFLLFEHDYVTVPNLGAFIANYQPASYNEISGSLMPPLKRIAFNEVLRQDDGLLAMQISRRENVSIDEAKKKITSFVSEIKGKLYADKEVSLDKIGSFSLNDENNLIFEPDRRVNYYSESFGLESLYPRRILKEIQLQNQTVHLEEASDDYHSSYNDDYSSYSESSKVHSKKAGNYQNIALYALPILFLALGLLYSVVSRKSTPLTSSSKEISKESPTLSSVNPLDYLPKSNEADLSKEEIRKPVLTGSKNTELTKKSTVKEKDNNKAINSVAAITEITSSETVSTHKTGRYKIIAGLFKNESNALHQKQKLINQGFENTHLQSKSNLVYVVVDQTDSNEEAKKIAKKVSTIIGENAIVQ